MVLPPAPSLEGMESGELFHNAHSGKLKSTLSLRPALGCKLAVVVTRPHRSRPPKRSPVSKAILSKESAARFCYGRCRAFLSSDDEKQAMTLTEIGTGSSRL